MLETFSYFALVLAVLVAIAWAWAATSRKLGGAEANRDHAKLDRKRQRKANQALAAPLADGPTLRARWRARRLRAQERRDGDSGVPGPE